MGALQGINLNGETGRQNDYVSKPRLKNNDANIFGPLQANQGTSFDVTNMLEIPGLNGLKSLDPLNPMTDISSLTNIPDPLGDDPFGVNQISKLAAEFFKPISTQEMNNLKQQGVYTSSEQMTPEQIKNITAGKVKNISAGTYGGKKLNQSQVTNATIIAATIVKVGTEKGQSPDQIKRAVVVALATAMQESELTNIGHGMDGDNAGLFQQRDNWGSKENRMNPVFATTKFANALFKTNYMNKSVTAAAQGVQRSGFPNAYAKWQNMAEDLANKMLS